MPGKFKFLKNSCVFSPCFLSEKASAIFKFLSASVDPKMCQWPCDRVYKPHTGPAGVNFSLWAEEAVPPQLYWAYFTCSLSTKWSSPTQLGWTTEERGCTLNAPALEQSEPQTTQAKNSAMQADTAPPEGGSEETVTGSCSS